MKDHTTNELKDNLKTSSGKERRKLLKELERRKTKEARQSQKHRQNTISHELDELKKPQLSTKQVLISFGLIVLSCLTAYAITLFPNIPGGDGSELIAVAHTLGVAHPPGYPLYTILGKLFTYIPFGSIAWTINLFSAFSNALASGLIFLIIYNWTNNAWAGVLSSILFAFSPIIWKTSVAAEEFALNNLLLALLIYLSLRFSQDKDPRFAYWGAFIFGLGMSNQHIILFIGIPLSLWIMFIGKESLLASKSIAIMFGCFVLGLLPYIYLPIASSLIPIASWGDQTTWAGFVTHITRAEYGTFRLYPKGAEGFHLFYNLWMYLTHLPAQTLYIGAPLALFGIIARIKKGQSGAFLFAIVVAFLFYIIVFHLMSQHRIDTPRALIVHMGFWQQANMFIFIWIGLGFSEVFLGASTAVKSGLKYLAMTLIILQLVIGFQTAGKYNNALVYEFMRSVLESLPPGAMLLSRGDMFVTAIRYLQESENIRKDVLLFDVTLLTRDWMKRIINTHYPEIIVPGTVHRPKYIPGRYGNDSYTLAELFAANHSHPIFVNSAVKQLYEPHWKGKYRTIPYGFVYQVIAGENTVDFGAGLEQSSQAIALFDTSHIGDWIEPGSDEEEVRTEYSRIQNYRSSYILSYAESHNDNAALIRRAAEIVRKVIRVNGVNANALYYMNLGTILAKLRTKTDEDIRDIKWAWGRYASSESVAGSEKTRIYNLLKELNSSP